MRDGEGRGRGREAPGGGLGGGRVPALRGRDAAGGGEDLHAARRGPLGARPLLVLPLPRGRQAEEALPRQDRRPGGRARAEAGGKMTFLLPEGRLMNWLSS